MNPHSNRSETKELKSYSQHTSDNTNSIFTIQAITEVVINAMKSGYIYVLNIFENYKRKKLETRLTEELHIKRAEFISLVLKKLPFLYTHSMEVENSHWIQIAYDLKLQNKLIPDIVRYQTGPYYFISFGSISTQIKREFFSLFLSNDKTGVSQMIYPTVRSLTKFSSHDSSDSYNNAPVKTRKNPASDLFEYFTSEEIKSIILNGDRSSENFYSAITVQDDSQKDWFHSWGYVYETEPDCCRALDLELSNYSLELAALDNFLKLGVSFAELPKTDGIGIQTLKDLIEEKQRLITEKYIPIATGKRSIKIDQLSKCKVNSAKYNKLMCY